MKRRYMHPMVGNTLRIVLAVAVSMTWALVVVPMFHVLPIIGFALGLPIGAGMSWLVLVSWEES
jgi:hypothetical protein